MTIKMLDDRDSITGEIATSGEPPVDMVKALYAIVGSGFDPDRFVIMEATLNGQPTAVLAAYQPNPMGGKFVYPMFVGVVPNMGIKRPNGEALKGGLKSEMEQSPFFHDGNYQA